MLKLLKTILTITIILINSYYLKSQVIRGMAYNHAVVKAISEGDKNYVKNQTDTLFFENEFFEDFSNYQHSVFPRNNNWADNFAYINSTYADSMISIGVATLDAYDETGYPYYSDTSKVIESDYLTSNAFKFLNPLTGTYYFSFFYQPGGKGDLPEGIISGVPGVEGKDSLLLDFYAPSVEKWINVFYTLDNTDTFHFNQVIIEVDDSLLQDGFRFRFRNYTSLPSYPQGQDLGMFGNADQWHIDYIQLKQAASAQEMENLEDIMVVEPLLPSLTEYTSVPWHHFSLAQSAQGNERRTIPFSFRTYYPERAESINSIDRVYNTYNLNTGEQLRSRIQHNPEPPFDYRHYEDNLSTGFYFDENDTIGRLEIVAYIETTEGESQRKDNDTLSRIETYYDHYAYDDGSAEFGFGISGEPQDNSRIALRFRSFRYSANPDSLKAVLIYFCKSVDAVTENAEYRISIRKNNGTQPANEVLYTSGIFSPDYNANLNEFTRIEIDPPLLVADTFFVVIEQLSGYLNIGYDINNNSLKNLYVYINQQWSNPYSLPKGSLMVRPSFGNYSLPTQLDENKELEAFSLYPNPAKDRLNFSIASDYQGLYLIRIFNLMGVLQFSEVTYETSVFLDKLNKGIYFIEITSLDTNDRYTAKFIKQ